MIRKIINRKGELASELILPPPQITNDEVGVIIYSVYYSSWKGAKYEMIQFFIGQGIIRKGYTRYYNDIHQLYSMMLLHLGFKQLPPSPNDNPKLITSFI